MPTQSSERTRDSVLRYWMPTYADPAAAGTTKVFAGEADGREQARAAAVSEERLPRIAHESPAGNGKFRPAGAQTQQNQRPASCAWVYVYLWSAGANRLPPS